MNSRTLATRDSLPEKTSIGRVRLRVADVDRAREFYVERLGLVVYDATAGSASFGPPGGEIIVRVDATRDTRRRPEGTPGLYHFAILFPDRPSLARVIAHLHDTQWPFQGFADHGVSEAAYLADPDGNGVELYVDRPRTQWTGADGSIVMYSKPLDLRSLLALAEPGGRASPAPATTRIGHVHLHVGDLVKTERFWVDVIGFGVTTRDYPGALFLAAGGYHHHLGANTWARNRNRPDDVAGLLDFVIRTGSMAEVAALRERSERARIAYTDTNEGLRVEDYEGNGVIIAA